VIDDRSIKCYHPSPGECWTPQQREICTHIIDRHEKTFNSGMDSGCAHHEMRPDVGNVKRRANFLESESAIERQSRQPSVAPNAATTADSFFKTSVDENCPDALVSLLFVHANPSHAQIAIMAAFLRQCYATNDFTIPGGHEMNGSGGKVIFATGLGVHDLIWV
jgi:hypothetical protein